MRSTVALMVEALSGTPVSPVRDQAPAHHRRLTLAGLCHHDRNLLGRQHAVAQRITPSVRAGSPSPARPWRLAQGCTCRTWFGPQTVVGQHCSTVWTHAGGVVHTRAMLPWNALERLPRSLCDYVILVTCRSCRHSRRWRPRFSRVTARRLDEPIATSSRDSGAGAARSSSTCRSGSTASRAAG